MASRLFSFIKRDRSFFWWGAALALVLALLVRGPFFGQVPDGLNRDEAALGYNAFSLLKTGADEHHVPWAISITSFGDQKLPGYVYTLLPFIALGGLNPTMVRLPSFLAGMVVILGMGAIAEFLVKDLSLERKASWLPALTMVLLAVSPWANHFSRVAYEAHLAMALFVAGTASLLWSLSAPQVRQRWLLLSTAICWTAAILTYHSYQVFLPLFALALLALLRRRLSKFDRIGVIGGMITAASGAALVWFGGIWNANFIKQAGISPFAKEIIEYRFFTWRTSVPIPGIFGKLLANRLTEILSIFGQHLIDATSASFYFSLPAIANHTHNVSGVSNLHIFLAPFVLLGLFFLWSNKKKMSAQVVLFWLGLSLVAPALTISPQHTIRIASIFPALELTAALGFYSLWQELKPRWQRLFSLVFLAMLAFSTVRLVGQYLFLSPRMDSAYSDAPSVILGQALAKYQSQADRVYAQQPSNSPYIWYIFQRQLDPHEFWQTVEYYPTDSEHFQHVHRVGNVYFETIQWGDLYTLAKTQHLILVFRPQDVPTEQHRDPRLKKLETLSNRFGEPVYEVWSLGPEQK